MNFKQGIRDGIPIGLGYAAVSFAFGILAVDKDLTVSEAVLISLTNLTSTGQFAGLTIIAELGTLVEMALSQFIINKIYADGNFIIAKWMTIFRNLALDSRLYITDKYLPYTYRIRKN